MIWPFARTRNTHVLIARTWMLWPFARTGNTDVVLWPFPRSGDTDVCGHGCSARSTENTGVSQTDGRETLSIFGMHRKNCKYRWNRRVQNARLQVIEAKSNSEPVDNIVRWHM